MLFFYCYSLLIPPPKGVTLKVWLCQLIKRNTDGSRFHGNSNINKIEMILRELEDLFAMISMIVGGMRRIKIKSRISVSLCMVGTSILLLLKLSVFTNMVSAQTPSPSATNNPTKTTKPTTNSSHPTLQQQQSKPNLHQVKITSPTKGQQIRVGRNLLIYGTSADNTTSDCKVSVIVNGVKPYHDAFPNGQNGQSDYSKWNFALTPTYTSIKEGQNKITSKFSCGNDPSLISHNSVNVTGAAATDIAATASNDNGSSQQQSQQQISSIATPPPQIMAASLNSTTANSTSTVATTPISSNATTVNGDNTDSNVKALSVSLHLAKSSLHPGDKQIIAIKVADKNSTDAVGGASSISSSISSPVHATSSNDNIIPLPGPVKIPDSSLFTSDNTDNHHHPHHDHTSTIISSTSTDTIPNDNNIPSNSDIANTNTNTDTNTNNKGHNHHSTIIPSTAHNTDNNTNTNNEQQTRSNTGGERDININSNGLSSSISLGSASSSSNTIGTNTDKNTGGLAQKIITNVKDKLEMRGIHLP
ncbi:MAG: hypothetical protein M3P08_06155 [Thermoproteota archaeon]|nr:hypothetical protein [Thermoproteota archaeon]